MQAALVFNPHELQLLRQVLRPGDAVLDVGANMGVYTCMAASCVTATGRVDAIEPHPENLRHLHNNLVQNGLTEQVKVHPVAVSDVPGPCYVTDGLGSAEFVQAVPPADMASLPVQAQTLDSLCPHGVPYVLGKMDIEGHEPQALAGARQLLAQQNPPVWLLEINHCLTRSSRTPEELAAFLAGYGYDLAVYDGFKHQLCFEPAPWQRRENVVALTEQGLHWLRERYGPKLQVVGAPSLTRAPSGPAIARV